MSNDILFTSSGARGRSERSLSDKLPSPLIARAFVSRYFAYARFTAEGLRDEDRGVARKNKEKRETEGKIKTKKNKKQKRGEKCNAEVYGEGTAREGGKCAEAKRDVPRCVCAREGSVRGKIE